MERKYLKDLIKSGPKNGPNLSNKCLSKKQLQNVLNLVEFGVSVWYTINDLWNDDSISINNDVSEYKKAKEEMNKLGFNDYNEYLDYLEFKKIQQSRRGA